MRVRLKLRASERTRLERSVWRAEKRHRCAGVIWVGGPIRPHSGVLAHSSAAQGTKRLFRWQSQANLVPDCGPLGECRERKVFIMNAIHLVTLLITLTACSENPDGSTIVGQAGSPFGERLQPQKL